MDDVRVPNDIITIEAPYVPPRPCMLGIIRGDSYEYG